MSDAPGVAIYARAESMSNLTVANLCRTPFFCPSVWRGSAASEGKSMKT